MRGVLTINTIRYLNIFERITRIRAKNCFSYNGFIYFSVPKRLVFKAIGRDSENLRKISNIINKKIKIIAFPNDEKEITEFIEKLVEPLKLKSVKIKNNRIIIEPGSRETKALLIGRNKKRLEELKKICKECLNHEIEIL